MNSGSLYPSDTRGFTAELLRKLEKLGNINHLVGNDTMSTKKHDNVYDHERRPSSNEQKNNKEDSQAKFYLFVAVPKIGIMFLELYKQLQRDISKTYHN